MKKYIVEAKEPQKGERASSGGIRGNGGRIVSQYTNPVPYREPVPQPAPVVKKPKKKSWFGGLLANAGKGIVADVLDMAWDDFGKPIVQEKITQAEKWAKDAWKSRKSNSHVVDSENEGNKRQQNMSAVNAAEDEDLPNNIIRFPSARVG